MVHKRPEFRDPEPVTLIFLVFAAVTSAGGLFKAVQSDRRGRRYERRDARTYQLRAKKISLSLAEEVRKTKNEVNEALRLLEMVAERQGFNLQNEKFLNRNFRPKLNETEASYLFTLIDKVGRRIVKLEKMIYKLSDYLVNMDYSAEGLHKIEEKISGIRYLFERDASYYSVIETLISQCEFAENFYYELALELENRVC